MADGWRLEFTVGGRTTGPARPPVIVALAIWIGVAPWLFHLHTVQITETVAQRQPLDVLFRQWAAACAAGTGPVQPIIVASRRRQPRRRCGCQRVAGGGGGFQPGRAVFAVSSVSGGSRWAPRAYMALLGQLTPEELAATAPPPKRARPAPALLAQQPLGHDVLGAL